MFTKLPPDAQNFMMERFRGMEAAHTRRSQEIAPMRQLSEKWDPYFQQLGTPAPQAIDLLLQTEYKLRYGSNAEKLQLIQKLVQDYGIQAPDEEGNIQAPNPEIASLRQDIQNLSNGFQQQHQQFQENRNASVANQVTAFAEAKGSDGQLAHPHFGEVEAEMTRLAAGMLQEGVQPNLDDLYERACWSTPTVRAKLMEQHTQAAAQAEMEKAKKAKKAGSTVSGAGSAQREKPKTRRQAIEEAWNEQTA